jgi:hypothetical protein
MLSGAFRLGISADDEFLLQMQLDFDLCSGALSGFILGTTALAD